MIQPAQRDSEASPLELVHGSVLRHELSNAISVEFRGIWHIQQSLTYTESGSGHDATNTWDLLVHRMKVIHVIHREVFDKRKHESEVLEEILRLGIALAFNRRVQNEFGCVVRRERSVADPSRERRGGLGDVDAWPSDLTTSEWVQSERGLTNFGVWNVRDGNEGDVATKVDGRQRVDANKCQYFRCCSSIPLDEG